MTLKTIKQHLLSTITTEFIQIHDNSRLHRRSKTGLTHIQIILVSNDFIHQTLIDRHRFVLSKISEIKKEQIYSITLNIYTVSEWKKKDKNFSEHQCLNR